MRFSATAVAAATGGRLHGPDVVIDGVSFDTRSLQPGQLFVPVVAERDGHLFVEAAINAGAVAVLSSRGVDAAWVGRISVIEVADTVLALMALATAQRVLLPISVIGITGSVGKTSTKDMTHAALSASRQTWANERSFNNEQGLPTTLLNTPMDPPTATEVLILEMGMRGVGQIAELCEIAQPTIGVVTRVAEAHSDLVGGIEGVARVKAELIGSLPPNGVAILNGDDHRVRRMADVAMCDVLTYGSSHDHQHDIQISDVTLDAIARPTFRINTPWGSETVHLAVTGRHMAHNAAAALACVGVVGGDLAAGVAALSDVGLTPMRMDVHHAANGIIILDDSYNANPTSMRAALDALLDLPAMRRVAVLGVMAEISDGVAEHRAIVEYARGHGIDVIACGTDLYGIRPVDDPVAALRSLSAGDAVLVKGSRVAGLDRVARALLDTSVDRGDVAPPR